MTKYFDSSGAEVPVESLVIGARASNMSLEEYIDSFNFTSKEGKETDPPKKNQATDQQNQTGGDSNAVNGSLELADIDVFNPQMLPEVNDEGVVTSDPYMGQTISWDQFGNETVTSNEIDPTDIEITMSSKQARQQQNSEEWNAYNLTPQAELARANATDATNVNIVD